MGINDIAMQMHYPNKGEVYIWPDPLYTDRVVRVTWGEDYGHKIVTRVFADIGLAEAFAANMGRKVIKMEVGNG